MRRRASKNIFSRREENTFGRVRGILFDFGGTLDSDGLNWKQRFFPLYRSAGLKWTFAQFEEYFHSADDWLVTRRLNRETYLETLNLQVSLVLKYGNVRAPVRAEKIAGRFWQDSRRALRRNSKILQALSRRYRLGIVSNFYGNLPGICRETGISRWIKVVIDSTQAGVTKPKPEIFLCALKLLRLLPEQALFVGDSLSRDLRGARALGLPHVWLNPSQTIKEKPCCREDRVIASLSELKTMLSDGKRK